MINDGANPLAEVALALAMAFFSLMILMLFAMVNAPKADATDPDTFDLAVETRNQPGGDEERQLVIFTNGGLFDEALNRLDPAGINPAQPIILAVSQQMPISRITGFQRDYPHLRIEIAELTDEWQARIAGLGLEAGQ